MPTGCCAGGECAVNKQPATDGRHLLPEARPTVAVLPDDSVGLAVKEMKA